MSGLSYLRGRSSAARSIPDQYFQAPPASTSPPSSLQGLNQDGNGNAEARRAQNRKDAVVEAKVERSLDLLLSAINRSESTGRLDGGRGRDARMHVEAIKDILASAPEMQERPPGEPLSMRQETGL